MSHEEDFIMQTSGQVSSAPLRRGSGAGRECLPPEGSPKLAPTRANSASSSSSTLREVTRVPPPPGGRDVFFCTALPVPRVPRRSSHTRKRAICHRWRRGCWSRRAPSVSPKPPSVRGCLPDAKLGVPREGKRTLYTRHLSQQRTSHLPSKNNLQASPLLDPWAP